MWPNLVGEMGANMHKNWCNKGEMVGQQKMVQAHGFIFSESILC